MTPDGKAQLDRIERLLAGQRRALLAGDLGALAAMPGPMEAALAHLAKGRVAKADLARLSQLAARNAELIGAASAAIERTRTLRQAAPDLGTYDRSGQRAAMMAAGRTLARG
jgi:hypothetical protein